MDHGWEKSTFSAYQIILSAPEFASSPAAPQVKAKNTVVRRHFGTMQPQIVQTAVSHVDAAPPGKRLKLRLPWDKLNSRKTQKTLRFPPLGKTESFARVLTHWEKRDACDILAEQQFLENVYRAARPDPAPVLAEVFAEAPRKKRRLDFPPPTAHETRRAA